ncbi:MAG: hypothetical protein AAFQ68_05775 [Bacteroidota bacterium]
MNENRRPNFSLRPQPQTHLKLRYAIGAGAIASLVFALILFSPNEGEKLPHHIQQTNTVQIDPLPQTVGVPAEVAETRKKIAQTAAKQINLQYQKAGAVELQSQPTSENLRLLKKLEDVSLKMALHQDDPDFARSQWQVKKQELEQQLTTESIE